MYQNSNKPLGRSARIRRTRKVMCTGIANRRKSMTEFSAVLRDWISAYGCDFCIALRTYIYLYIWKVNERVITYIYTNIGRA